MFCSNCGIEDSTGGKYCRKCGVPITRPNTPPASPPQRGVVADFGHQMGVAFLAVVAIGVSLILFFMVASIIQ